MTWTQFPIIKLIARVFFEKCALLMVHIYIQRVIESGVCPNMVMDKIVDNKHDFKLLNHTVAKFQSISRVKNTLSDQYIMIISDCLDLE